MPSNENKTIENIFAYDGEIIDIQILDSKGIDTLQSKIYFCGVLLNGGTESTLPYNECFFGSLDSNENLNFNNSNASDSNALDSNLSANDSNLANTDSNNDLDESKPIYYLECDLDLLDSNLDSNVSSNLNKSFESNSNSKDSNKSNKSSDSNLKSNNSNNNLDSLDSN
ncbi:hypothetical protein, partial [Helicobacter sp. T3_23-1059]